MESWREELYHSSGPWKEHKYIKKVGTTYYYKSDPLDVTGMVKEDHEKANQTYKDMQKNKQSTYEKQDNYVYNKPDSEKSAIGAGLSKVTRFLQTGSAKQELPPTEEEAKKKTEETLARFERDERKRKASMLAGK